MPESNLEKSETEYHQKVCQNFAYCQARYEQAKESLKGAEREYLEAVGAHNSWFNHLAEKYQLSNRDRVSEEGQVIKGEREER